jgi:glycosyltransferase involved in cell wall biosynthesis
VLLHALLSGLRERHEVTLVTVAGTDPNEWQALEHLRSAGLQVHAVRLMEASAGQRWERRARLAAMWLSGRYPWRTIWFWDPRIERIISHLLATQSFDVVHVEDNAAGAYRYRTTLPTLLTEHEVRRPRPIAWDSIRRAPQLDTAMGEIDWARWQSYQRRIWRRFDAIQVFGERDAEAVRTLAPDLAARVRINPFGVAAPPARISVAERPGQLLFVGNFTHAPNLDAALWLGREIMPQLRQRQPRAHLMIVGADPPPAIRALASESISVTGFAPAIEPIMDQAAVVIAPLRIGGGMRMKVLQSMALGKAVVTTTRGAEGLASIGPPPLRIADDTAGFVSAAADLLEHPAERVALGAAARLFVAEHFSPAAFVRRVEQTYRELLVGREVM